MGKGNPYHDERGRFCSGLACKIRLSESRLDSLAEDEAETWQDNNSEVEYQIDWSTGERYIPSAWSGEDYDDLMERELESKKEEVSEDIEEVYTAQVNGLCAKIKTMDYETLKSFSEDPEECISEVADKAIENSDLYSPEYVVDEASEDVLGSDAMDLRYRRIVAKCNGHQKLFAMADDEEGGYGLNGCASDYATQKIRRLGLQSKYEDYKIAKAAYERGDQAQGKKPSEYKSKKAYIMAKMAAYKGMDSRAQRQFALLQSNNPMTDDYHTGIRSAAEIHTFDEVMGDDVAPDFTAKDAERAKSEGYVTVFSSKPIKTGSFVTPSKMEAQSYAGDGEVYSQRVKIDDVAWIDGIEGQYAALN